MSAPSEDPELLFELRADGVAVITLNRPRAKNTVSFTMWEQFSAALDRLENATPARMLLLCGAEGYFSNGGDVKLPPARGEGALRLAARLEMGQRIIRRLRALPIPTVAAVEGGAYGVSWSLAMACDMIFAADNARFGAPFLDFGLVPDGGAAWFLTRQLGRARAAEIIFSGRTLEAAEALSLGLVSRLVPPGEAVAQALALGATIGGGNAHAVELTKRLLDQAESGDLSANHALELVYCHTCQAGEEVPRAREAFKARAAAKAAAKIATGAKE
ncbi:MAG: enoyl-CoA hydratase/isomerase family protein [Sphingobium yanoikuyae]|jgi:enoyl-CoA hydratase/carnithine racemase|uniref:enoyl-CoA hydratase/isomerase family protein n=1 Tax=Sphingobium TaxID=165695 RepID=UPI001B112FFF|nr:MULTISPECIES: enoyl-CoA hydratase/isomerase family protein [Sphingobium]MBO9525112.1 enoyl-CoA hydratase/isomerase family protein [Sphingobium yanoikuyae]MBT2243183.1 enoyl-CoA hydratase/isomerase family protein [Sphingobium sp. BHU LFT2]